MNILTSREILQNHVRNPGLNVHSRQILDGIRTILYLGRYKHLSADLTFPVFSQRSHLEALAARNLNEQIRTWNVDFPLNESTSNRKIKELWENFYTQVQKVQGRVDLPEYPDNDHRLGIEWLQELNNIFESDINLEGFIDTDLVLYPDRYRETYLPNFSSAPRPAPLPPNGIVISDFRKLYNLYLKFMNRVEFCFLKPVGSAENNEVELYPIDRSFQEFVGEKIRIILSRKEGRKLIEEILSILEANPQKRLLITPGDQNNCGHVNNHDDIIDVRLNFGASFIPTIYSDLEYGHISTCEPSFSTIFHELVHARNKLSNPNAADDRMEAPPHVDAFFNKEEELTIQETNEFGKGFYLPNRVSHKVGINPSLPPEKALSYAIERGGPADIYRVISDSNLTREFLEYVIDFYTKENVPNTGDQIQYLKSILNGGPEITSETQFLSPFRPPKPEFPFPNPQL